MGPVGCPETSVTTNLRWVTSQKSEDLIYRGGSVKSRKIGHIEIHKKAVQFHLLSRHAVASCEPVISCFTFNVLRFTQAAECHLL
jgi:hypothetical protein